jgi:hypothetical protein
MLMAVREYLNRQGLSMGRIVLFIGLTAIAGGIVGILGELFDWSHGLSFVVTVVVCAPISLSALWEGPFNWVRRTDWRRTQHRPSS